MARPKGPAEPSKYLSIAGAAELLDVSTEHARRLIDGIRKEAGPGKRYSEYVLAGHGKTLRVSAAAIVDYSKYSDILKDPDKRTSLRPFDIIRVERYLGIRQSADPDLIMDYDRLAASIVGAFFKAGAQAVGRSTPASQGSTLAG